MIIIYLLRMSKAADLLCTISNEAVMDRIYCVIGTIHVDIHMLRNAKKMTLSIQLDIIFLVGAG